MAVQVVGAHIAVGHRHSHLPFRMCWIKGCLWKTFIQPLRSIPRVPAYNSPNQGLRKKEDKVKIKIIFRQIKKIKSSFS